MKIISAKLSFIAILLCSTLTGCFGVNREFKDLRNDILDNVEGRFRPDVEFAIGSAGIGFASAVVAFSDAEDYADDILRNISGIQIGVYENRSGYEDINVDCKIISKLSEKMSENGWEYIIRNSEHNNISMIFIRSEDAGEFEELFIISLNSNELAMVELRGDLSAAIDIAIRENGLKFHMAQN